MHSLRKKFRDTKIHSLSGKRRSCSGEGPGERDPLHVTTANHVNLNRGIRLPHPPPPHKQCTTVAIHSMTQSTQLIQPTRLTHVQPEGRGATGEVQPEGSQARPTAATRRLNPEPSPVQPEGTRATVRELLQRKGRSAPLPVLQPKGETATTTGVV